MLSQHNVHLVVLTPKITSFDQNTPTRILSIFSASFADEREFFFHLLGVFFHQSLMTFDPANTERCVTGSVEVRAVAMSN